VCSVKCGIFYGKNLHVIPKVSVCCFVTKKFGIWDFGGRVGDKMAEWAAPVSMPAAFHVLRMFLWLKPFLRYAVSGLTLLRASPFYACGVSKLGLKAQRLKGLKVCPHL